MHVMGETDSLIVKEPGTQAQGSTKSTPSWMLNRPNQGGGVARDSPKSTSSCLPHRLPLRHWQEFDNNTEAYLILNTGEGECLKTGIHPRSRQCLFWRRWFPMMMQQGKSLFICYQLHLGYPVEIKHVYFLFSKEYNLFKI